MRECEHGRSRCGARIVDIPVPRLAEYLDEWLERRRTRLRPSTHRSYRQLFANYLVPTLGDRRVDHLDRRSIERAYAELFRCGGHRGRPLAPKTVQYCHSTSRRALEDARLDGLIDDDPADGARPPRLDPDDDELDDAIQVWTGEQARSFLAFVADHAWRGLWHLAVGTGARRSELLGLRWQDVDLELAHVRLRRGLTVVDGVPRLLGTKTSRPRVVSIATSVVEAMARHRDAQGRLRAEAGDWHDRWGLAFTAPDGVHLDPQRVTMEFRKLVRPAPVPVIRLHDLRHTHASLLLGAGVPIKVVSERLGHTTIAMTMDVYGHLLPGMDADAAARFDRMIGP